MIKRLLGRYRGIHMRMFKKIFRRIKVVNDIRKVSRNWINITINAKINNFPISVRFRDGRIVIVDSMHELFRLICEKKYNIVLKSQKGVGDFISVFILEEYKFLRCKNKLVIDIGAEVGDSSIYFAMKGAVKVVAIEPMPYNFVFLKENIKSNQFDGIIEPLNIMIGNKTKRTMIEVFNEPIVRDTTETTQGYEIDQLSLNDLLKKYYTKNSILKLDCEGCEYNLVNLLDNKDIQNFERIQIEYHYGLDGLVDKLHNARFKVKYTKPIDVYNPDASNPNLKVGYIYAKRRAP